jgi:hypothetical protein
MQRVERVSVAIAFCRKQHWRPESTLRRQESDTKWARETVVEIYMAWLQPSMTAIELANQVSF